MDRIFLLFQFALYCTQQNAMLGNCNFQTKSGGARAPPGPSDATPMATVSCELFSNTHRNAALSVQTNKRVLSGIYTKTLDETRSYRLRASFHLTVSKPSIRRQRLSSFGCETSTWWRPAICWRFSPSETWTVIYN